MNYLTLYEPIKEAAYKLSTSFSQNLSQNKDLYAHPYAWIGVIASIICSLYAVYLWRKLSKKNI